MKYTSYNMRLCKYNVKHSTAILKRDWSGESCGTGAAVIQYANRDNKQPARGTRVVQSLRTENKGEKCQFFLSLTFGVGESICMSNKTGEIH